MARDLSSWLPGLLGITTVESDGTAVTPRGALNFIGATVTSNAEADSIDVEITAGGSTPTGTGLRKVVSGTEAAAAALLVNADVDAAAAIAVTKLATAASADEVLCRVGAANAFQKIVNANVSASAAIDGSKVAPDFGSQRIVTTGGVTLGATPASAGDVRLKKDFTVRARNSGNTKDLWLFDYTDADALYVGSDRDTTTANQVTTLGLYAAGAVAVGINGSTHVYVTDGEVRVFPGHNFGVHGGAGSTDYGGGTGVMFLGDATTAPTTNPADGVIHYAEGGVPRVRSEAGHIRRLDHRSGGFSNVQRCVSGTLPDTATTSGNTTVGCTFRMLQHVHILGIRFFWPFVTATPSYTIKCSIWNEDTTSLLATVSVAVSTPGVYEGFFASPITDDLTADDIGVGLWENSGTRYPRFAADSSFYNSLPLRMNDLVRLIDTRKYSAGDARPTSNAGTERYGLMDLILNT